MFARIREFFGYYRDMNEESAQAVMEANMIMRMDNSIPVHFDRRGNLIESRRLPEGLCRLSVSRRYRKNAKALVIEGHDLSKLEHAITALRWKNTDILSEYDNRDLGNGYGNLTINGFVLSYRYRGNILKLLDLAEPI